ncbi:S9 family peptidase [Myxococcota bacterium]|nr:S9 family peptidase [Myxococcota bacterium]MBU1382089.1 S9 family peptidase [Myxococcota bacterium]MBU1495375.1 S9 family peptidase [Myxococcota bacterium]
MVKKIFLVVLLLNSACQNCPSCPSVTIHTGKQISKESNKTGKHNLIIVNNNNFKWISLDDAVTGKPLGKGLINPVFSPDGKIITYLKIEKNGTSLWQWDVKTGKHSVFVKSSDLVKNLVESDQEKADRERKRISFTGITSYQWSPDSEQILFPLSGDLYLYNVKTKTTRKLTSDSQPELNPSFSPDGQMIAWVKKGNLEIYSLKTKKVTRITKDASDTIFYGRAEFVAMEEMDRQKGYFWSPDSKNILYFKVDETKVSSRQRLDLDARGFRVTSQRYPAALTANATVTAYVTAVNRPGGKKVNAGKYEYIARAGWITSGEFYLSLQDREQKNLTVKRCQLTGNCSTLLDEMDDKWVELHDNLKFIEKGKRFFWSTDNPRFKATGYSINSFRGLFLLERTGAGLKVIKAFNSQPQQVFQKLLYVNEAIKTAYISVFVNHGTEIKMVAWNYETTSLKEIVREHGWHSFSFSKDGSVFVDQFSSLKSPAATVLRDANGTILSSRENDGADNAYMRQLPIPDFVNIAGKSGSYLNAYLYKPANYITGLKYPAIVYVYGGPHGHMVRNTRNPYNLWNQFMAQHGFIVIMVDGRGGMYRNRAFEKAPYLALGRFEVEDNDAIFNYLKNRGDVDETRIGIWGWSYGGYSVLASLSSSKNKFASGVAVAPPTDWRLYDTHYTERYHGLKPEDYKQTVIDVNRIKQIKSQLLIIHGMSDDNVLLINSLKVIRELQNNNSRFQMMLYPGSAHSLWGKPTRTHLISTITDFFMRTLSGGQRHQR